MDCNSDGDIDGSSETNDIHGKSDGIGYGDGNVNVMVLIMVMEMLM